MDKLTSLSSSFLNSSSNQLNNSKIKSDTIYFGVHIPSDNDNSTPNVFSEKDAALKAAKKHKKSRFKAFSFYHEAVEFSLKGAPDIINSAVCDNGDYCGGDKLSLSSTAMLPPNLVGEKASPFRTPRPQELIEFRNKIESGNLRRIKEWINFNPRYLVSSGDTPSILQEGARLNALHIAAKNHVDVVQLILNTISDTNFIRKLYGDDNQENNEQRCKMLLDLYLNTPSKGANDTPLHIASKWGVVEVVELLLSYPECDKMKRNKYNLLAEEVICERFNDNSTNLKKRIKDLFSDSYYVPVLRSEDNTLSPLIGEPFSPTNPPILNHNILSPRIEIRAYAGPMEKKDAESFRKVWKTPPRSIKSPNIRYKTTQNDSLSTLRLGDPDKGLERIGKILANDFQVGWKEYWDFLDEFIDISSDEGLTMLESHLRNKEKNLYNLYQENHNELNNSKTSPLSALAEAFSQCKINDSSQVLINELKDVVFEPKQEEDPHKSLFYIDKACQIFANRIFTNTLNFLYRDESQYGDIVRNIENEVKLLELIINSYMDDERFRMWVNFKKIHSRVGQLVGQKLYDNSNREANCYLLMLEKLDCICEGTIKKSDYFSSDDEAPDNYESTNKPTVYKDQVVCLITKIKEYIEIGNFHLTTPSILDEHTTKQSWTNASVCNCIFHTKKLKRNNSRNNYNNTINNNNINNNNNSINSKNQLFNKCRKIDLQRVSKKLFSNTNVFNVNTNSIKMINGYDANVAHKSSNNAYRDDNGDSDDDDDDDFYTPPSTPPLSDDEEFFDAEPGKFDVFLEGSYPSKTDCSVFNALEHSKCQIDRLKYPSVYKWRHLVGLYTPNERKSWLKIRKPSNNLQHNSSNGVMQTPPPASSSTIDSLSPYSLNTSNKSSWFRVTGMNSPRAAVTRGYRT